MSTRPENAVWPLRSLLVMAAFGLVSAVLVGRAIDLQVIDNTFLRDQGQARHLRVVEIPAHRGMITDANGEPMAVSTPVDSVWVNPQEIDGVPAHLGELAHLLGIPPKEILGDIRQHKDKEFVYLRRDMSPDEAQRVMKLGIDGIYLQREYRRYYPAGEVTAHVLGFTNIDDIGQEGLELAYDSWLRGESGAERVIKDRLGRMVQEVDAIKAPRPGKDLQTTIDLRVQYLAYRALKAAVMEQGAKSGSIVVLDARTGDVLAIANQPSFNPNNRDDLHGNLYRNRAVTDPFEPGSSFKPFVIAAALATGRYRPQTMVDTAPGYIRIGNYTINDERDYGRIDLTRVLEKSSNVGATRIALSLKPAEMWSTLANFGFGTPTGSGYPGEADGTLRPWQSWSRAGQAAISYGYGVSVTALQLAEAYMIIADGGVRRPLTFVPRDQLPGGEQVLAPHVALELRRMLETVVSPEGTGTLASVPGYHVAGKTGTARKAEDGGYSTDQYTSVFAGMAPASQPRLVTVVIINQPSRGAYYGGLVSAPVFSQVMSGALRMLDIAPDDLSHESTAYVIHLRGHSS